MHKQDLACLVALSSLPNIGPRTIQKLARLFPTYTAAWTATVQDFILLGVPPRIADIIHKGRKDISDPAGYYHSILDRGIKIISCDDPKYPPLLKKIHAPPPILYARGALLPQPLMCAVVGTRQPSSYGRRAARRLSTALAQSKITVVSGLALGIDSLAHEAAYQAGGITWAVLASGVDESSVYPRANARIARGIIDTGGCLLSEYPPLTQARPGQFPSRNRIIAGICQSTLVVEAPQTSGALITAYLALEYNREVWAVPGEIDRPTAQGVNQLLARGALMATDTQALIASFGALTNATPRPQLPLSRDEAVIFTLLEAEILTVDDIIIRSGLPLAQTLAALTNLELKGLIKNSGQQTYEAL